MAASVARRVLDLRRERRSSPRSCFVSTIWSREAMRLVTSSKRRHGTTFCAVRHWNSVSVRNTIWRMCDTWGIWLKKGVFLRETEACSRQKQLMLNPRFYDWGAFRWRHGEFDGKLEEILFLPDAVGMGGDGAFLDSASWNESMKRTRIERSSRWFRGGRDCRRGRMCDPCWGPPSARASERTRWCLWRSSCEWSACKSQETYDLHFITKSTSLLLGMSLMFANSWFCLLYPTSEKFGRPLIPSNS